MSDAAARLAALRAELTEALQGVEQALGERAMYRFSGAEVQAATDAVLPVVERLAAELDGRDYERALSSQSSDGTPALTAEEATAAMEEMATDLYRAQDRIALVREMLDRHTGPLTPERVRAWLDQPACPRAESEQQQITRLAAELETARATLAAVEDMAERGDRKGYQLDPADVLDVLKETPK